MTTPVTVAKQTDTRARGGLALPIWLRNPAGGVLIASALFGLLGVLTVVLDVGRPYGRFSAYGFIETTTAQLSHETPEWWPPIAFESLQYGDQLVTINGLLFTPNAKTVLADAYAREERIVLEVERPGSATQVTVELPVEPFSVWDLLDLKLPDLIVGVVFWLLAAVVLHARSDLMSNRVFAAVAACVAAHRLTTVTSVITDTELLINIPKMGHMLAAGLIGPLLIHLALLFPTRVERMPTRTLVLLYFLGNLSGITLALSRLNVWNRLPPPVAETAGSVAYQLMLLLLLAGFLTMLVRLLRAWAKRHDADKRERRVVRIVLAGLILSLPPVLVVLAPLVPPLGISRTTFIMGLDLRYFMLAIPIAFALAIVRYQTFQSASPLFIFVIAVSISAFLADFGAAVWMQSLPVDRISTLRPPFPEMLVIALVASIFWSRQAGLRGWFGRFLNRTERNYESVRSFGRRVMGRKDIRAMPESMAQALVNELELERAVVWLWQPETLTYELTAAAGIQHPSPPPIIAPPADNPATNRIMKLGDPQTPVWLAEPMAAGRLEVIVQLEVEGRSIGLLGLGRRWDEEIFDERDLAIVELAGQQAVLFILAASQVEELRRVPERVAAAQEQERYRLAGELHDTIQQFLGRLPFFLTVSRDKMEQDPEGAAAILDRCMADVENASIVLREIRANLAPNQLEISLIKPLANLAAHLERQSGLSIHLDLPDGLDEATSVSTRHALYRVIQQATDNVVAHADATEVTIALQRANGRVMFSVIDNGRGSNTDDLLRAISRGSFGLQSMRARVETVGGEFAFQSMEDGGTVVSGWVPVTVGAGS